MEKNKRMEQTHTHKRTYPQREEVFPSNIMCTTHANTHTNAHPQHTYIHTQTRTHTQTTHTHTQKLSHCIRTQAHTHTYTHTHTHTHSHTHKPAHMRTHAHTQIEPGIVISRVSLIYDTATRASIFGYEERCLFLYTCAYVHMNVFVYLCFSVGVRGVC